jgi:thiamine biosynthesis lipoprotein
MTDITWKDLLHQLHGRIEVFDKTYSRFRPDSLVTNMSKTPGDYPMPDDGFALLQFYHRLYTVTDGYVTPLIGQTMVEAGYDASYSLQTKTMHHPLNWEEVLAYNADTITIKRPNLLDFGAAGKGYLVDILGSLIEEAGINSYTINASGDIRHRSARKEVLEIGLENPLDASEAIGVTKLTNASLCASAGSKRQWGELNHIIDPITLQSPEHIIATWVIADDTMTADGLATALFFTDPDVLARQFSFTYALLHEDMSLHSSHNFPLTVFEAN